MGKGEGIEEGCMMDKQLRKQKLKEIQGGVPVMTGIPINYRGIPKRFDAYQIPIEFLIYNPYNGRIGSFVKSYEVEHGKINPETEEGEKIIEHFLLESKKNRNDLLLTLKGEVSYAAVA